MHIVVGLTQVCDARKESRGEKRLLKLADYKLIQERRLVPFSNRKRSCCVHNMSRHQGKILHFPPLSFISFFSFFFFKGTISRCLEEVALSLNSLLAKNRKIQAATLQ